MRIERIRPAIRLLTQIALELSRRFLDVGELPREGLGIGMILAHVSLQFLLRAPPDVHPCAAHLGAAEGLLMSVDML